MSYGGLWNGYKEEEEYKQFLNKMKELDIDVIDGHTSRTSEIIQHLNNYLILLNLK